MVNQEFESLKIKKSKFLNFLALKMLLKSGYKLRNSYFIGFFCFEVKDSNLKGFDVISPLFSVQDIELQRERIKILYTFIT